MIKNILTLSIILLIISCSNNNNQTNTNAIETQTNETKTNELKQAEELNDSSHTPKNIEWISHHYYMKNDEGDFFSVYLNDRWPDYINSDSELIPNYEKIKAAFNYKNLNNDVNQFYDKNSILDITNNIKYFII